MKVLRDLSYRTHSPFKKGSVLTLGNFDGFHLAHQKLVRLTIAKARRYGLPSALLTFYPHPRDFFAGKSVQLQLMRLSEKWLALQTYSLDYLISLRFNQALASLPAIDFVNQVLVDKLNVKAIFVGDDFHFGAGRTGDYALLKMLGDRYDFEVERIAPLLVNGERVSSQGIRRALQEGNLMRAQQCLGMPYSLYGPVVYGDQRGRQWGFPTANIPLYRDIPPLTGIYAVRVYGPNFVLNGVASIGFRPVFEVKQPLLEVFILDFNQDIYGQHLRVEFLHKLREEQNFESVDALIKQIHQDVAAARAILHM